MKHLRSDWDGIQDENQGLLVTASSSIEYDEPVFLLRAKDPAAAAAVYYWARIVAEQGGDPDLVRRVSKWSTEMTEWRNKHYPYSSVADVPIGFLK